MWGSMLVWQKLRTAEGVTRIRVHVVLWVHVVLFSKKLSKARCPALQVESSCTFVGNYKLLSLISGFVNQQNGYIHPY